MWALKKKFVKLFVTVENKVNTWRDKNVKTHEL